MPLPDDEEGHRNDAESGGDSPASPPVAGGHGGTVDEYPVSPRTEQRLIDKAVAGYWPMSRKARRRAVRKAMELMDGPDPVFIDKGIARLVSMGRQNVDLDKGASQPPGVNVFVSGGSVTIQEVLKREPGYVDYLEHQRLTQPGPVGGEGIAGPMANGASSRPPKPGTPQGGPGAN